MIRFPKIITRSVATAMVTATLLSAGPVFAKNDDAPGQARKHGQDEGKHGNGGKHGKDKHDGPRAEVRVGGYFNDQQREAAHRYYVQQYPQQTGRCPPGLAKKHNGCMPPGQAKKYALGRPLPSDVVYYAVPRGVLVQLPPAPMGHEYVRVAADILLIAVGTHMVVDAMSDLMR
ncbi:MAG TPA: hypothetical protein VLJ86_27740 [Ramlibacter sp.]|nr:hypothetical protein [Ramlibacter sp.]